MNVNYSTNTTTLTNLTAYTMYVINMSAIIFGGIGLENTASDEQQISIKCDLSLSNFAIKSFYRSFRKVGVGESM